MNSDPSEEPRTVAIEQLKKFGLSAYAAETFVTLVSLGRGTAKDVSRTSDVPRTRVYDAAEELQECGLVEVQHASPKEFRPKSIETARRTFERDLQRRITLMTGALQELESRRLSSVQYGVWTVEGQRKITEQVLEFVSTAREEVVYATAGEVLTDEIIDGLAGAAEEGVAVRVAGLSEDARDRLEGSLSGVELIDPPPAWPGPPAGRLLMTDGQRTLVSVVEGTDGNPGGKGEIAIWGAGPTNGLADVLTAIIGDQLPEDG